MRIGITGATGGLGRRLVEILSLKKNMEIKVLVRNSNKIGNMKDLPIQIYEGDICNKDSLKEFIQDLDICCHLASEVNSKSVELLFKTNVLGTKNICESILSNSKCRLIYCSSIVVKNQNIFNKFLSTEYTKSKCEADKIVKQYTNRIKVTKIYPGYIFGGYDKNYLSTIIKLLDSKIDFLVKGGEKKAPVVYVDDLCKLFYLCIINEKSIGKDYIGIPDNSFGIHDFIKCIAKETNKSVPKKIYPKYPLLAYALINGIKNKNSEKKNSLSIRIVNGLSAKAKYSNNAHELGWNPQILLEERVKAAIEDYKKNNRPEDIVKKKLEIIGLKNDGRCKWLGNRVLKKLLPEIKSSQSKKKIFVIEDWISNDDGKVGVDLAWLYKLEIPVAKSINDLPTGNDYAVINTGYDSIYEEEMSLKKKGIEVIDEPCPAVRQLRNVLENFDHRYQCVLLCEPNHIIIKNYKVLFPKDMILIQMENYKEKIVKFQNGKPLFLLPYVTFLPKHVSEIFEFIEAQFSERKNTYVETKCMWVSGVTSPIEEINKLPVEALENVRDALMIITEGTTNKSVTSLTETLVDKGLNVIKIGSINAYKEYEKAHLDSKILLVKSPIPNNAESEIVKYAGI